MELLRRVASFGTPVEDMKNIYFLFIRSLLEQSATVWHSSLTEENSADLERVQKCAVRIMLGNKYIGYKDGLLKLDIENLSERKKELCLNFVRKCITNPKTKHIFPENVKNHPMKRRMEERFKVNHANTERLRESSIIYMQHLLNEKELKN